MNKEITFRSGVPKWLQKYCRKLHKLLAPEWTVIIQKSKIQLDPNDEDTDAETDPNFKYLDARIVFGPRLKNNVDGRRIVAHEFLHLTLHGLATDPSETMEEQTVTKLAKVIEELVSSR